MTTIFVTGGSSPLGRRLLPQLVGAGGEVVALARSEHAAASVGGDGITVVPGDLLEPQQWRAAARDCDTAIHLAGIRFAPQLIQALSDHQPLVALSSASVANPDHPSSTELAGHERALADVFKRGTILRPTMIYGTARDRNLRYLARFLMCLPRVPTFTGGSRIQPVHVDDVVAAIRQQLIAPRYQVLPVGGPDRVQIHELVDIMAGHLRLARTPLRIPLAPLARLVTLARVRKLHRVLHAAEMLAHDRTVAVPDRALLGRDPTPLVSGVRDALVVYGFLPA